MSKKTEASIHYYDTDNGYIHYVSKVLPGLECRVYDSVESVVDIMMRSVMTLQFLLDHSACKYSESDVRRAHRALFLEASEVSSRSLAWMDRLMTRSPLRDHKAWSEGNGMDSRAEFLRQRQQRRDEFKSYVSSK